MLPDETLLIYGLGDRWLTLWIETEFERWLFVPLNVWGRWGLRDIHFYCCTVECSHVDIWCRFKIDWNSVLASTAQCLRDVVSVFMWFGKKKKKADFTSGVHVFIVLLQLSESNVCPWELRVNRAHLEKTLGKNDKVALSLDSEVILPGFFFSYSLL